MNPCIIFLVFLRPPLLSPEASLTFFPRPPHPLPPPNRVCARFGWNRCGRRRVASGCSPICGAREQKRGGGSGAVGHGGRRAGGGGSGGGWCLGRGRPWASYPLHVPSFSRRRASSSSSRGLLRLRYPPTLTLSLSDLPRPTNRFRLGRRPPPYADPRLAAAGLRGSIHGRSDSAPISPRSAALSLASTLRCELSPPARGRAVSRHQVTGHRPKDLRCSCYSRLGGSTLGWVRRGVFCTRE
ncbi:hypothetical protein BRADI_1g56416v3 [Brachypodium distachyon]|uniref:Uncharacterized protein n=1 Tax=Brachypodium distachyon TaxID=15368 RepID=A0A0Q3HDY1_BRADI|nr:hypothetical protein BRADI_1g56416v3 [Brachypodium distachyon]